MTASFRTTALLIGLGLMLGACSKCDIPDWLPKLCRAGPPVQNSIFDLDLENLHPADAPLGAIGLAHPLD